ncbi:UDP-N-acetylmuramoylalanine--D-glutamate ligase [Naumannella halotolerans]|uniref:UDP-N-acetylmuramoylalanine--D-glutamate ligase n=1 Tax=Naumannella halotolerans TaxID=993414 RepID=A0A4R7J8V2_9ACTN|nr:UDP-N-acetylmuramoyl-L-alanine--D-glutamate ligase [Naumannella halotolerans]TDT32809.1 UDP-N-acetylmuramoylalanine--D-glutamate ligase [Naumannella halotolerans]
MGGLAVSAGPRPDGPDLAGWRGPRGGDHSQPWPRATVVVGGIARSGFAVADALLQLGARVIVCDESDSPDNLERATLLEVLGAEVRLGTGASAELPARPDLLITSPGWRPDNPLLRQAAALGVPIWGEPELAWRMSDVPWLAITGTNGKTTTTRMLAEILTAAGLRTAAVGNTGAPITETVLDPEGYDVLAVELSSFQLHWSNSIAPWSAAVLNLAEDHVDWHGSMQAYAADKARIYSGVSHACVYNVADPATEQMVVDAEVVEGARAIGFTLGVPGLSMLGVVDDLLVDRAFVAERRTSAAELLSISELPSPGPYTVANALAAAALARSFDVSPRAVRDGLRASTPLKHRMQLLATTDGIDWIDDSKATNPAAAEASLASHDSVVWIAGGQAKGATFDDLVRRHAPRLRAAVLIGVDAERIAEALRRHAPQVPLIHLEATDSGVMRQAVERAHELARPGDAVLLAPGAASHDMWSDFAARGRDFAAAVATVTGSDLRTQPDPDVHPAEPGTDPSSGDSTKE